VDFAGHAKTVFCGGSMGWVAARGNSGSIQPDRKSGHVAERPSQTRPGLVIGAAIEFAVGVDVARVEDGGPENKACAWTGSQNSAGKTAVFDVHIMNARA